MIHHGEDGGAPEVGAPVAVPDSGEIASRRERRGKLATVCGSVIFTLLMCEIVLRMAGVPVSVSFERLDPDLGWSNRPGASGWYLKEGRSHLSINSDGMRDVEHAVEKPDNTLRILLLGDSFVAACEVEQENTFGAVLERELGGCPALGGRHVEVLELGSRGYGTAQEWLLLQQKGWKYRPDIVLLAFFGGNDLTNAVRSLNRELAPYYTFQGDELVLDSSFNARLPGATARATSELFHDVSNRSLVLRLLLSAGARLASKGPPPRLRPRDISPPESLAFQPPTDPRMIEAWRVEEALLRSIHADVRAHGAELRVVGISAAEQVHPDLEERRAVREGLAVETMFYVEERIGRLARSEGFSFLSLPQAMAEEAGRTGVFFHGFENANPWGGHWNERGHLFAGKWLAASFCARLAAGEDQ